MLTKAIHLSPNLALLCTSLQLKLKQKCGSLQRNIIKTKEKNIYTNRGWCQKASHNSVPIYKKKNPETLRVFLLNPLKNVWCLGSLALVLFKSYILS